MSGSDEDQLLRAANTIRRSVTGMTRRFRSLRADHGVSAAKLSLLGRLHRAGRPLTATDAARLERLQPQSLTRLISDLEEGGFIRRRPDHVDRRQVLIELTAAGRDLLVRDAMQQNAWLAAGMMAKLTDAERALLGIAAQLLDRLSEEGVEPRPDRSLETADEAGPADEVPS